MSRARAMSRVRVRVRATSAARATGKSAIAWTLTSNKCTQQGAARATAKVCVRVLVRSRVIFTATSQRQPQQNSDTVIAYDKRIFVVTVTGE